MSRPSQPEPGLDPTLGQLWAKSRRGGWAGRGFRYQDEVGTWLACRMLSGELAVEHIVPEGLDDIDCAGHEMWHVQAKSIADSDGIFRKDKAATFIAAAWRQLERARRAGRLAHLAVIFERPVADVEFGSWGEQLAHTIDVEHPFRDYLTRYAKNYEVADDDVEQLMQKTTVIILDTGVLQTQAQAIIAARTGLPSGLVDVAYRELCWLVRDKANENASKPPGEPPAELTRASIDTLLSHRTALVNKDRLLEAERTSVCEPLDLTPLSDSGFYLGVHTKPGHVGAGLVMERPDVTAAVDAALTANVPVLLTGPSGVGKSAAAWSAATALGAVAWHRVLRLNTPDDVALLIDLARHKGATQRAPVGFIVDSVTPGDAAAWDQLVNRARSLPGVAVLGTARTEDLFSLTTRTTSAEIPVTLTEELAATIHRRLRETGDTSTPHWRAAYDAADGLTLEFCHLLTQGRRLSEVIGEQVDERLRATSRDRELEILAIVATAHTWHARIPVDTLRRHLGLGVHAFHAALRRLADEHLLRESGGMLTGRHYLRSTALAKAIHAADSPALLDSAREVIGLAHAPDLARFIAGFLIDNESLSAAISACAVRRVTESTEPTDALTALLHAANVVDTHRSVAKRLAILQAHDAPPSSWVNLLRFSSLSSASSLMEHVRPEVASAFAALIATDDTTPLLEQMVTLLTPGRIAERLVGCTTVHDAVDLLGVLHGAPGAVVDACIEALDPQRPLVQSMHRCDDLATVADALSTAYEVSRRLATALALTLGTAEERLDRIRHTTPRMVAATLEQRDGSWTAVARLSYLDEEITADPETTAHQIAALMLSVLPDCEAVDVKTTLPGGLDRPSGEPPLGSSRLERTYIPSRFAIARHRSLLRLATNQATPLDRTRWLGQAAGLLDEIHLATRDETSRWVTGTELPPQTGESRSLVERRTDILRRLDELPSVSMDEDSVIALPGDQGEAAGFNQLYTLGHQLLGALPSHLASAQPAQTATYLNTGTRRALLHLANEPWHLIGIEAAPPSVAHLDALIRDLIDVLSAIGRGTLNAEAARLAAHDGPHTEALQRIAQLVRDHTAALDEAMRAFLETVARHRGITITMTSQPLPHLTGPVQPPYTYSALIAIESAREWPRTSTAVVDIFTEHKFNEPVVLVPCIGGLEVQRLALTRHASTWTPAEMNQFASRDPLRGPSSTPVADAAWQAYTELYRISGLSDIGRQRPLDEYQRETLVAARRRLTQAQQALREMGDHDAATLKVAESIQQLADMAADEDHEPTFAAVIASRLTGRPAPALTILDELIYSALDIDIRTHTESA